MSASDVLIEPTSHGVNILKSAAPILVGIALAVGIQFLLPSTVGPYYSRLVIDAGIAMILAVSLNIVNGMTGQFSIGHAGFMTIGAYTAGSITFYSSLLIWGTAAKHGSFFRKWRMDVRHCLLVWWNHSFDRRVCGWASFTATTGRLPRDCDAWFR